MSIYADENIDYSLQMHSLTYLVKRWEYCLYGKVSFTYSTVKEKPNSILMKAVVLIKLFILHSHHSTDLQMKVYSTPWLI